MNTSTAETVPAGSLKGHLSALSVAELALFLGNKRASGRLQLSRGAFKKTILLRDGLICASTSNEPRELLGQVLMNLGHISEEQFTKAFQTQQETRIVLGRILVMTGQLSEELLLQALVLKAREIVLEAFRWTDGSFSFTAGDFPVPDEHTKLEVPLLDLHREGEFREQAWAAIRAVFPSGAMRLSARPSTLPVAPAPQSFDGRLLSLIADGQSLDELLISMHATDFFFHQRLYALWRAGAVVVPPDASSPAARPEVKQASEREAAADRTLSLTGSKPRLLISPRQLYSLDVSAPARYLLSRVDGERTLEAIVRASPLPAADAVTLFRELAGAGFVDLG